MMRTTSLLALGFLAGVVAFGTPPRWESATYVEGNVKDLAPNTAGTLQFAADNKTLYFSAGSKSITIPYATIDKAELGPTKSHNRDIPLYKIWALPKRLSGNAQTQYLSLRFKTPDGEENNMTFEVAQTDASAVLYTIETRSGLKPAVAPDQDEGWGDDYWKTARTADKFNTKTVASNQQ